MSSNFWETFSRRGRLESDPALNSDIYDEVSHFTITQCLMFVTTRCCSIIAFKQVHYYFFISGMDDYSLYLNMPVNCCQSLVSCSDKM